MEVTLYNRTLEKDINKRISPETLKDGEIEDWMMEIDAIRDSYEDIDLKDYGISESMAFKIIKYATARLFSKIDPQIAAREETLAEQYFTDLGYKV